MRRSTPPYPLLSLLVALDYFAVLQTLALWATDYVLEYPLDDVYIHLAMADSIAAGSYGVNPGEYASASSSALYPLLLLPIVPPDLQRLLPLFWNVVGLVAAAWLWGAIVVEAGFGDRRLRAIGYALSIAGPVALNMPGVASLGMEHTLHTAATLAIFLGLMLFLKGTPNWTLLYGGILLSPLLRFEGLAFALVAVAIIYWKGERRHAATSALLALAPLALFCLFLFSIGVGPLPNSIVAKLAAMTDTEATSGIGRLVGNTLTNLESPPSLYLLAAAIFLSASSIWFRPTVAHFALLCTGAAAAVEAHVYIGRFGWADRYEHYAFVLAAAGLVTALGRLQVGIPFAAVAAFAGGAMAGPAVLYLPDSSRTLPTAPLAIRSQPYLVQALVKEVIDAPVAVNDIGWVSWRNPNYVVDLWGLASPEARRMWVSNGPQGWADDLVAEHGAHLAMIYEHFLSRAVGADWVRLGSLKLRVGRGYLAGHEVTFYATDPVYADELRGQIKPWAESLPPTAEFKFEEASS